MTTISRRRLLTATACTIATGRFSARAQETSSVTLQIPLEAAGPRIPADFVGLSYEVQQLAEPGFFSPQNTELIQRFRDLSQNGVLRLGGNTSEFAWWKPTAESSEPEHPQTRVVEGEPKAQYYPVTAEAVRNLAGFLQATGWTCLYRIGMGTNVPERAAAEGQFVATTLGDSLQYFQIGNEVDLFSRHLRDAQTWSVKTYLEEWLGLARAIAERVPGARFGMPDVATHVEWLADIADRWPSVDNPPNVTRLTHHYYFGGPATNPDVNITRLLSPATMAKVQKTADVASAAAKKMGVRVRMTEGNTCYRGGKPGLSDAFASALWAADYSLLLARNNYSGVNLHGGTGKSVANSVGGFLPGDVLLEQRGETPAQIATHPHPFYTPIATFGPEYTLEPVAYGLKFAGLFSGATLITDDLTAKLQTSGVNASAYAALLADRKPAVIILNKDAERDLGITLDFGTQRSGAVEIKMLHAPALDSREAHISDPARETLRQGIYTTHVKRATGICVHVK